MKKLAVAVCAAVVAMGAFGATYQAADFAELKSVVEKGLVNNDVIELTGTKYDFTEPLTFEAKSVTVRGTGTERAVLDGQGASRGFIFTDDAMTPTLENLVFTNFWSAADNGGALSHNNTTVMSILNCAFRGNRSTCPGPALSVTGKAVLTGCEFTGNVFETGGTKPNEGFGGGAVIARAIKGTGSLVLTNCAFTANREEQEVSNGGGGVINGNDLPITLVGCGFTNNSSVVHGGCIFGNVSYMTNCTFSANTAVQTGGCLSNCNKDYAASTIVDCAFTGNAAASGGAVRNHSTNKGKMSFVGCTFRENTATSNGGAIHCDGKYLGSVIGCTFDSNAADSGANTTASVGGAVSGGCVFMDDCTFTNNVAKAGGAAIYGDSFPLAADGGGTVTNCTFTDNRVTASWGGVTANRTITPAGIYIHAGQARVRDCTFLRNGVQDHVDYSGTYDVYGSTVGIRYNDSAGVSGCEIADCTFTDNVISNMPSGKVTGWGCVYLSGCSNVLRRCTFANNRNSAMNGRGSAVTSASTLKVGSRYSGTNYVIGCTFTNNVSTEASGTGARGTVVLQQGTLHVIGCDFLGNSYPAATGSGAGGFGAYPHNMKDQQYALEFLIDSCRFIGNTSGVDGGAVYVTAATDWPKDKAPLNTTSFITGYIRNSLFRDNVAAGHGGAVCTGSARDVTIESCTFVNNRCGDKKRGGAVYLAADFRPNTAASSVNVCSGGITNCLFYGNTVNGSQDNVNAHVFCNSAGEMCGHDFEQVGPKNFLTDGLFGNLVRADPGFADAAAGDYTLSAASSCRNAGINQSWMVGATYLNPTNPKRSGRIAEQIVDIGCYEYWPVPGILLMVR